MQAFPSIFPFSKSAASGAIIPENSRHFRWACKRRAAIRGERLVGVWASLPFAGA
jgi:hypothetical protein